MTFKNAFQLAVVAAALAIAPQVANATVYAGQGMFTDNTTGNTLQVSAMPNPASFNTGNLSIGQSYYDAGFMTITTKGDFSTVFGSTQTDNISLKFTFTSPSAANGPIDQTGIVSQTEFRLTPTFDFASLTFANDTNVDQNGRYARQTVTFGDGSQAYLDVYDTAISGTTTARAAQLDIRLTNVKGPTAVPEPMSMALLATGLISVGMVRRRKQSAAKSFACATLLPGVAHHNQCACNPWRREMEKVDERYTPYRKSSLLRGRVGLAPDAQDS